MNTDKNFGKKLKKPLVETINGLVLTNDNGVLIIEPVEPSEKPDDDFIGAFNEAQKHFDELRSERIDEIVLHIGEVAYSIRATGLSMIEMALNDDKTKDKATLVGKLKALTGGEKDKIE